MKLRETPAMRPHRLREEGHKIDVAFAPKATWEGERYRIELRALIERGRVEIRAGRVVSIAELMAVFDIAG